MWAIVNRQDFSNYFFSSKIHKGNVQLSWGFFRITFIEMAGAIIIHNLTWFFFIDWSHGPCGESSGGSTLNHHLDLQKKEFEKDFTKTSSKLNKRWKVYLQRGAAFGIPKIISYSFFHKSEEYYFLSTRTQLDLLSADGGNFWNFWH